MRKDLPTRLKKSSEKDFIAEFMLTLRGKKSVEDQGNFGAFWKNLEEAEECIHFFYKYKFQFFLEKYLNFSRITTPQQLYGILKCISPEDKLDEDTIIETVKRVCSDIFLEEDVFYLSQLSESSKRVVQFLPCNFLTIKCFEDAATIDFSTLVECLNLFKDHYVSSIDFSKYAAISKDFLIALAHIQARKVYVPFQVLEYGTEIIQTLLNHTKELYLIVNESDQAIKFNFEFIEKGAEKIMLDFTHCQKVSESFLEQIATDTSFAQHIILPNSARWKSYEFLNAWKNLKTIFWGIDEHPLSEKFVEATYEAIQARNIQLNLPYTKSLSHLKISKNISEKTLTAYYGCLETYIKIHQYPNSTIHPILHFSEIKTVLKFPFIAYLTLWNRSSKGLSAEQKRHYLAACEEGYNHIKIFSLMEKNAKILESFFSSEEDFKTAPNLAKKLWKLENRSYADLSRAYLKRAIMKLVTSDEWDDFLYDEIPERFDSFEIKKIYECLDALIFQPSVPRTLQKVLNNLKTLDIKILSKHVLVERKDKLWKLFKHCLENPEFHEFVPIFSPLTLSFKNELLEFFADNGEKARLFSKIIDWIVEDREIKNSDQDLLQLLKIGISNLNKLSPQDVTRALKIFDESMNEHDHPLVYVHWMVQFLQYHFPKLDAVELNAWNHCFRTFLETLTYTPSDAFKKSSKEIFNYLLTGDLPLVVGQYVRENKYLLSKFTACGEFFNQLMSKIAEKDEVLWLDLFKYIYEKNIPMIQEFPNNQKILNKVFENYHTRMKGEDSLSLVFIKTLFKGQPSDEQLKWCGKICDELDFPSLNPLVGLTRSFPDIQKIVLKKMLSQSWSAKQKIHLTKLLSEIAPENVELFCKAFHHISLVKSSTIYNEQHNQAILSFSRELIKNTCFKNRMQLAQFFISYYPLNGEPTIEEVECYKSLLTLLGKNQIQTYLENFSWRFSSFDQGIIKKQNFCHYSRYFLSIFQENALQNALPQDLLRFVVFYNHLEFAQKTSKELMSMQEDLKLFIKACIYLAQTTNVTGFNHVEAFFCKHPWLCERALDQLTNEYDQYPSHFFALIATVALVMPLSEEHQMQCYQILRATNKVPMETFYFDCFPHITFHTKNTSFFEKWIPYMDSIQGEAKLRKHNIYTWAWCLCRNGFYPLYKSSLLRVIKQSKSPTFIVLLFKSSKLTDEDKTEILSVATDKQKAYYHESFYQVNLESLNEYAKPQSVVQVEISEEALAFDIETEYLALFDQINVTDPRRSDFVEIKPYLTEQLKSINALRASLKGLLVNIKACHKIEGTPDNPVERKKYYDEIENLLKASLAYLKKEPFKNTIAFILILAQAGAACSEPYRKAAITLYNTFCPQKILDNGTFEEKVYSIVQDFAWKCVTEIIVARKESANTHYFTAYETFFKSLLGFRPGLNLELQDPLAEKILMQEISETIRNLLKNSFFQKFNASTVIEHLIQQFPNKPGHHSLKVEELTDWANGHKIPNDQFWTEDYTTLSRAGILLLLERIQLLKPNLPPKS